MTAFGVTKILGKFDMSSKTPNGFILLEVLMAISLVLGAWMTSIAVYQKLSLYLIQQETKRTSLRKEFDKFEHNLQLQLLDQKSTLKASSKNLDEGVKHASSRAVYWHRALRPSAQPASQD